MINDEFREKSKQIKQELSDREIVVLLHELIELNKQKIAISHRIDNRQALENHRGKKWTAITVAIMVCAFYVEIVKIDDISILKNRAIDFIHSATDTYKVKVD